MVWQRNKVIPLYLLCICAYISMIKLLLASYCAFIVVILEKSKVPKSSKKFVDSTNFELQKKYFDSEVSSLTCKII